jgi:hypothetical protein
MTQALQTLLTTTTETIGAVVQFNKRPDLAKFTASTFVQTLALGWLAHPDARLDQLAASAARVGVDVSAQAIDQRFSATSAALLQGVVAASIQHAVTTDALSVPILKRFTGVYVHDSTTIALPDALAEVHAGCGGSHSDGTQAALKCGVQLDLRTGALPVLELADGRQAERALAVQHTPLPSGSLRLADLGFFDRDVFRAIDAAGSYWLSKLPVPTVLRTSSHGRHNLHSFVTTVAAHGWDGWVWVGKERGLRARLLITPVPQEVADQRRRRLRAEARKKGRNVSAEALALAAWTILLTNVPATMLSCGEALVLARVRWQIELVFKLWKSHGQLASWRTQQVERIRCEVYAKLLAMVIQHWALVVGCWSYADRSLVKAARVVREFATDLASTRLQPAALRQVLEALRSVLGRTARMESRRQHPATFQLLLALTATEADA